MLVEDNPKDTELILYHISILGNIKKFTVMKNGEDAIDFLFYKGQYENKQHDLPTFILLDITLPGIKGDQVLAQIRSDPKTQNIPVFVFTDRHDYEVINRCKKLSINGYFIKSEGFDRLIHALKDSELSIQNYVGESQEYPVSEADGLAIKSEDLYLLEKTIQTGIGSAVDTLNLMTGLPIQLDTFSIALLPAYDLTRNIIERLQMDRSRIRVVGIDFIGKFSGLATFAIAVENSDDIINAFAEECIESDSEKIDVFSEMGNILVNYIVGSIANLLKIEERFDFSIPLYFETEKTSIMPEESSPIVLVIQLSFNVNGKYVESDIALSFKEGFFEEFLKAVVVTGTGKNKTENNAPGTFK